MYIILYDGYETWYEICNKEEELKKELEEDKQYNYITYIFKGEDITNKYL